ncbi:hypothetical protein SteCoe_15566 [Stentor coeruleus]|uniref:RING-type domain-containing protein n=1 Tax=Stentor coeruleus TaxID=5963 RepID=A0A1R2C384_9CILI|nr:hypothetical protein SteCoe_15566 [Stentor coeruleus]
MKKKNNAIKSNDNNGPYRKMPSSPLLGLVKLPQLTKPSLQLTPRSPRTPNTIEETSKSSTLDRKSNKSLHNLALNKLGDDILNRHKIEDFDWHKEEPKSQNIKTEPDDISPISITNDNPFHDTNEYHHEPFARRFTKKITGTLSSDNESQGKNLSIVPIKSKKYRIDKNPEIVITCQDDDGVYKENLENEKKKYHDLEEKYNLMVLEKSMNESYMAKSSDSKLSDYDKSALTINFYKSQLEEMKIKLQIELTKSDKEVNSIREELHIKNLELDQISNLLSKTDLQRKRYAETVKILETELQTLKNDNTELNNKIFEANSQLKFSIQNLATEQNKAQTFENGCKELDSLKSLTDSLKQQSEIVSKENSSLKAEVHDLKTVFSKSKNKWREKKRRLKEKIINLTEKIEKEKLSISSKVADSIKIKKNYTIREHEQNAAFSKETISRLQVLTEKIEKEKLSISSKVADSIKMKKNYTIREHEQNAAFSKETISRLQVKSSELEEKYNNIKTENDRLMKSLEYYKNSLENKSKTIGVLETKLSKITENELDIGSSGENGKIITMLEKNIHEISDAIYCNNCKKERVSEYLMIPCEHTICSKCVTFEENCPICLNSARIFAIGVFSDILGKFNYQVELLNCLKDLNNMTS